MTFKQISIFLLIFTALIRAPNYYTVWLDHQLKAQELKIKETNLKTESLIRLANSPEFKKFATAEDFRLFVDELSKQ